MNINLDTFNEKAGPLPVWTWVALLLGGGYIGYRYLQGKKSTGTGDTTNADNVDTSGGELSSPYDAASLLSAANTINSGYTLNAQYAVTAGSATTADTAQSSNTVQPKNYTSYFTITDSNAPAQVWAATSDNHKVPVQESDLQQAGNPSIANVKGTDPRAKLPIQGDYTQIHYHYYPTLFRVADSKNPSAVYAYNDTGKYWIQNAQALADFETGGHTSGPVNVKHTDSRAKRKTVGTKPPSVNKKGYAIP